MSASPVAVRSVGLPLGSIAVDFQLKGVDGKTYSLKSLADKKALAIVFSCNHCPYVQAYETRMVQLQRDYLPKGAGLVAINSNDDEGYPEDSFENMITRSKENGLQLPIPSRRDSRDCPKIRSDLHPSHLSLQPATNPQLQGTNR